MDNQQISQHRAQVIEETINLEWITNSIISQHYFKQVKLPFLLEVLYDEYFTLGLKRRILEKIIKDPEQKKINDFNRIITIRNHFAHCNQEIVEFSEAGQSEGKIIDPRNLDRVIDFDKLYEEFVSILPGVQEYLVKIFIQKGGKMKEARKE